MMIGQLLRRTLARHGIKLGAAALLIGAAAIGVGIYTRHAASAPQPGIPALTICQLTVTQKVPVPPPADMTYSSLAIRPAAGGGYEITGVVDVHPEAGGVERWRWTCDVEMRRDLGWYAWRVTLDPLGPSPESARFFMQVVSPDQG